MPARTSWLRAVRDRLAGRTRPIPTRTRPRLSIEALEDRAVPSAAWPMWGQNGSNTGQSPYNSVLTSDLAMVAGSDTGFDGNVGALVIGNDFVYVKQQQYLKALNPDGSLAWRFSTSPYARDVWWNMAVAEDGTVYMGTGNGDGTPAPLLAVNPNTPGAYVDGNHNLVGGLKWSAVAAGTQGPPLIGSDGTVYLTGNGGFLGAFDPNDGTRKWTFNTGDGGSGSIARSPDGLTLYAAAGGAGILYALDAATGQENWRFDARVDVHGAPAVSPDGTIYFIDEGWKLSAISTSGVRKWQISLGSASQTPISLNTPSISADGQTIYAGGTDGLYAVSPAGAIKWKYAAVRMEDHPAIGGDGTVYFGNKGVLRALTPTGALLWSDPAGGSGPAIGADGTLYSRVGDQLRVYQADGVGRPSVGFMRGVPAPVVAGGSLSLRAYDVRDQGVVQSVSFYLDADGNGILDPEESDQPVGTNTTGRAAIKDLASYYWGVDVTAPAAIGSYTYFARATDDQGNVSNTVAAVVEVVPPPPPTLSVGDASVVEGAGGTGTELVFTITRGGDTSQEVTVDYATADGTAVAGSDYTATSSTLTFAPGQTTRLVHVPVLNDAVGEPTEAFSLNLSSPIGATITDGVGVATILDDETKFYVVDDAASNRTYEYGASGTAGENYALNAGNTAPRGAASTIAGDKVWVVDANKTVYVYSAAGALLGSWAAGSLAANATVEGITVWGSDVWLVDAKQDKVFRYTGAATRLSGSQTAATSFNLNGSNGSPKDLLTDGTSIWVVDDAATDKVFKYTLSGPLLGSWTLTGGGGSPTGIALDPTGASEDLWVVDNATDRVYQYAGARSRTSGSQSAAASFALAAGNTNPQGIADPPAPALLLTAEPAAPGFVNPTSEAPRAIPAVADPRRDSVAVRGRPDDSPRARPAPSSVPVFAYLPPTDERDEFDWSALDVDTPRS